MADHCCISGFKIELAPDFRGMKMAQTSVLFKAKIGRRFYSKLLSNIPLTIPRPMSLRVFFRSSELLLPASKPYICPSCRNARSFANVASRKNTKSLDVRRFIRPRSRSASTITPVTTVHSPPQHEKDSPKTGAFKDLYLALIRVQNRRNPYLSEKLLHACTETLSTKPGEIRPVKVAGQDYSIRVAQYTEF